MPMGAASLFGVVAPNSGNQKILAEVRDEEQNQKWLIPLTEGKLESGLLDDRARLARLRSALAQDHARAARATSG